MCVVIPRGPTVHEERNQLFGFPGILTLRSLHKGACGEEDVHAERSTQDPIQGDPEGPGQREKGCGFEAAPNIVSCPPQMWRF